jgi:hypothetical protein
MNTYTIIVVGLLSYTIYLIYILDKDEKDENKIIKK